MWIAVTKDLLISRVTEPERKALATAATASGQDPLADIAADVVSEWRGALRTVTVLAAGSTLPDEIMTHALADFRYRAFTRLPGMKSLLDDLRVKEWDRANHVRDNLKAISFESPVSGTEETTASGSGTEYQGSGNYPTSSSLNGLM